MDGRNRVVDWLYISGRCWRCDKYYELPRQGDEAHAYFILKEDRVLNAQIICVDVISCNARKVSRGT